MKGWIRATMEEIGRNTMRMSRRQKAEYVLTYYWYHMLLVAVGAGLLILLVRHLFFGAPPKELVCVIVNQQADHGRDEALLQEFAEWSGMDPKRILVDSDYIFSYGNVRLEGANESSYEKFFFRWRSQELDAVLMPESFYRYCKEIEYDFADLRLYCTDEQRARHEGIFIEENGIDEALYVENTRLMPYLKRTEEERMVLVFVPESEHMEAGRAFLEFALEREACEGEEEGAYEETQY